MIRSLLKSVLTLVFTTVLITPALGDSRLQSILANGELRVGTTGDWNPMTMIDPNSKERTGFDIDIANALATDMGVKVVFVPTTWKTLVNGVVADKYDMTSSASLSPKRALVAGYSGSYFAVEDVPLMLRKNKGKYNSWEDLNNPSVTVAVTLGTVQEKRAEALFDKSKIIKVSSPARDYQEVLAGRADISMTSNLEAAKLDYASAQVRIGSMYMDGFGVEKNYKEAREVCKYKYCQVFICCCRIYCTSIFGG